MALFSNRNLKDTIHELDYEIFTYWNNKLYVDIPNDILILCYRSKWNTFETKCRFKYEMSRRNLKSNGSI